MQSMFHCCFVFRSLMKPFFKNSYLKFDSCRSVAHWSKNDWRDDQRDTVPPIENFSYLLRIKKFADSIYLSVYFKNITNRVFLTIIYIYMSTTFSATKCMYMYKSCMKQVGPNCLATQNGGINIKMKFSMLSMSSPGGLLTMVLGNVLCGSSKMIC